MRVCPDQWTRNVGAAGVGDEHAHHRVLQINMLVHRKNIAAIMMMGTKPLAHRAMLASRCEKTIRMIKIEMKKQFVMITKIGV